jgi:predicted enzyme related to lactoylglutathione lyase
MGVRKRSAARPASGKRAAGTGSKRASRPKPTRAAARPKRAAKPAPRGTAARRPAASPAPAPTGPLGSLRIHLSYTTHDLDGVRRFYGELLGAADRSDSPRYASIPATASTTLGFGPPEEGPPESWRPPGEPMILLEVADVDAAHRDLVARGIRFEDPPRDARGRRVAMLRDPEGRRLCLAGPPRRTP